MMNREKIAKIVRALLDKTVENGATEGEAMAAAAKAKDFMDRYQIEAGSVGLEEEGVYKAVCKRTNYKILIIKDRFGLAVSQFTETRCWLHKAKDGGVMIFFGLKSDADFAVWLMDSLEAFITSSCLRWIAENPIKDHRARWEAEKAFVFGAADRISERLKELAKQRTQHVMGDGKSLVVVKSAIVTREFAKLNIALRAGSASRTRARDGGGYSAGKAAGDRASFGRPVNGPAAGGGVLRIGAK